MVGNDSAPFEAMVQRGTVRRLRFPLLLMAVLLAISGVAKPVAAQDVTGTEGSQDALLPPWPQSTCVGEIPIVVGSDVAAQSDIYSAVTLAGVLGTDCVVFAGPRDGPMSSDQNVRLIRANPDGWIVGGTAAVAPWKTAFVSLQRIAGSDRWHTARLVGAIAVDPTADVDQIHSETEMWNPLTEERECAGSEPIVVASDAAAQSDVYSAVTLAGVLGTDCIVFAGPRDGPMPSDQAARLASTLQAGWIVGGDTAVPAAKVAGRSMERIAGSDRWQTARQVGAVAVGLGGGS